MRDKKTLIGLKQILDYLDIGKPAFYNFIEMGLPAAVINNRWYAHTDNIDDYFRKLTNRRNKDAPKNAE